MKGYAGAIQGFLIYSMHGLVCILCHGMCCHTTPSSSDCYPISAAESFRMAAGLMLRRRAGQPPDITLATALCRRLVPPPPPPSPSPRVEATATGCLHWQVNCCMRSATAAMM